MAKKVKPHTPQWMLRRFASRVVRIVDRHEDIPAVAAHAYAAKPSAARFIMLFDRSRTAAEPAREHREGKEAVARVVTKLRAWSLLVANAVGPSMKIAEFGDRPDVPEDVLQDARRLVRLVLEHRTDADEPLPFAEMLAADLGEAIATASKEWGEAAGAASEHYDLRAEAREAARAFELDLVALRAALKAELGSSHPDYQKLRRRRARTREEDDDATSLELLDTVGDDSDDDEHEHEVA